MTTSPPDSYVPYVRRRNTPAQLNVLDQLFKMTPHPTRAQRQALANEIDMQVTSSPSSNSDLTAINVRELKSVTNWFQNRRQTSRKKSLTTNENNPLLHGATRYQNSEAPLDRSKISLDRIAALSERPSLTLQLNSARSPLTPRKGNATQQRPPSSPSKLWTHMLSSPAAPPPSPAHEETRLAALSSREKTLYPLEWACLKARQKKWDDEDAEESTHPVLREVDEGNEDCDSSGPSEQNNRFSCLNMAPQMKDVEAAITLLGFKMGS